jgi:hypothetical protein
MLTATLCWAKIDLVTLPARDTVQLTIYNSADLTLARENRSLVLNQGTNELQFSWENTLIDPTSLEMTPKAQANRIDIASLVFPPRVRNLGVWQVQSEVSASVPVEITYLTSGLSWRAFYMGTLSPDETNMDLQGYVRVTNNSGEDYENAQVRLIVGEVHLLDEIAVLARRAQPYGSPIHIEEELQRGQARRRTMMQVMESAPAVAGRVEMDGFAPKSIEKKGLSEYFLYTIEGTETIPHGWSKRLLSFDAESIPVVNLYKYEEDRYGDSVIRFLSFTNDQDHQLGETPLPGGQLKVYRDTGSVSHLAYTGASAFKYIPVNEEVELNLGSVADVKVEPVLMETQTDNIRFDQNRNVNGFDSLLTYEVTMTNTREIPVTIEIRRNFNTVYWNLSRTGFSGTYERIDQNTVKFTQTLQPRTEVMFGYTVRLYRGTRQDDWREYE